MAQIPSEYDNLRDLDLTAMWIAIILMSILLIALSITMYRVCRQKNFRFLITLISLLIVADIAIVFLSVGLYFE